jgi:hypothetical protein
MVFSGGSLSDNLNKFKQWSTD